MPTSLKSGSIPKVRASSGMIGTIRGPRSLSRMRFRRIRVKTIVVETAVSEPAANSLSTASGGAGRVIRRVLELRVGDRQLDPVAEDLQLGFGQLLRLVGDVPGLDAGAERP